MAKKTKFVTSETIVTADFANSIFGGLKGSTEGSLLDPTDVRITGHVHDGKNLDGHVEKISLANHVTDELDGALLEDNSVPNSKLIGPIGTTVEVEDDGVSQGDFTVFDFVGTGVTATDAGSGRVTVTIPGASSDLEVEDEGVSVGTFSSINFVGAGITATDGGGGTVDVTVPAAATVDLQEAYDNGNSITIPSGGDRVLINTATDAGGLSVEHSATSYIPGLNVNCQNSGSQGILVQVRDGPLSQVVLGDGRTTSGATGGSCAGYFSRFASSTNTDQAVVYIDNASASDDQPALRLNQNSSGVDALEVNGTSLFNDNVVVDGDVLPAVTDTYDLGSPTFEWGNLYLNSTVFFDGFGALNTQASLFVDNAANADTIFREDTNEWLRLDSSLDRINFSNSGTVNSEGTSITVQCTGDAGTVILNPSGNADVIVQEGGTEWLRFSGSQDAMGFVNDALITTLGELTIDSGTDITFSPAGSKIGVMENFGVFVLAGSSNPVTSVGQRLHVENVPGGNAPPLKVVSDRGSGSTIADLTFDGTTVVATNQRWMRFVTDSGIIGSIRGNGDAATVVYETFTGGHVSHFPLNYSSENIKRGMIVVSNGERILETNSPYVVLADKDGMTSVMGVYSGVVQEHDQAGFINEQNLVNYNALGDGVILVTNKQGPIANGDLIESSAIPGYGQLQNDDVFRSKTVAKCTQDIDWGSIEDTIEYNGSTYKWALVTCTYHCG